MTTFPHLDRAYRLTREVTGRTEVFAGDAEVLTSHEVATLIELVENEMKCELEFNKTKAA